MGTMRVARLTRWTAVLAAALAALVLSPTAAFAKGDMAPTSMSVVITGPGLDKPISASWKGSCFVIQQFACSNASGFHRERQGFPSDLGQVSGLLWTLGNDSNFLAEVSGTSGSYRAPSGSLGPKYEMRWTLSLPGRTETIVQSVYPWGPSPLVGLPKQPWVYTEAGETPFGEQVEAGWMPATPILLRHLVQHGLPAVAPQAIASARPVPADPPAAAAPVPAAGGSPAWPLVAGAAMLLVLVAAGVLVGRPRRRIQPA
jgi:hypothetical protein